MMHFVYECTVERKQTKSRSRCRPLTVLTVPKSFTPAHTCRMGRQLKVTDWGGKSMEADANLLILAEGSARFKCNYKTGEPYWCQSGQHQWRVDSRSEWRREMCQLDHWNSLSHTQTQHRSILYHISCEIFLVLHERCSSKHDIFPTSFRN